MRRRLLSPLVCLLLGLALASGCSRRPSLTRAEQGDRDGVLHLGNFGEPRELDPHLATGIPEVHILYALGEGLVRADGTDLHATPGVAERWETSPDGLTWTFYLRADAKWSDGEPITAPQFVASWKRVLAPGMASETSYYDWVLKNAEAYNKGKLADFDQVGVHAVDDRTLRLDLANPTPYLPRLLLQRFFFPVYLPAIEKTGGVEDRSNQKWTLPGSYVGNGPFVLTEWKPNELIVARKNPHYWNAKNIRINEVRYYPIALGSTEESAFRAGQLHKTSSGNVPPAKLEGRQRSHPGWAHLDPYLGVYFYLLNTTKKPLDDVRVRRALAMSVDRTSLVKNVTRTQESPAYQYTPPDTAGYNARARVPFDPAGARKLLADAGFPGGQGFPALDLLFNDSELHAQVAQAVQAMWQKELGVSISLGKQEWGVYLNSRRTSQFTIARGGWIGSLDPSFFLENMLTGGANNQTGWGNPEYDRLVEGARGEKDPAARYELFQKAETILMDETPVVPVYFYTNTYLLRPSVRGWHGNLIDYHPFEELFLEPAK